MNPIAGFKSLPLKKATGSMSPTPMDESPQASPPSSPQQVRSSPTPRSADDEQMREAISGSSVSWSLKWISVCSGGPGANSIHPSTLEERGFRIYSPSEFMPLQTKVYPLVGRKITETLKRGTTWDSSAIDQTKGNAEYDRRGLEECQEMGQCLTYLSKNALSLLLHHLACDSLLRTLMLVPRSLLEEVNYGYNQWKRQHDKGVNLLRLNEKEAGIGRYYLSKDLLRCGDKNLNAKVFLEDDFKILKTTIDIARADNDMYQTRDTPYYPFVTVAFGGDKAPEDVVWAYTNNSKPGTQAFRLDFNNCLKLSSTAVLYALHHFDGICELSLANVLSIDDTFLLSLAQVRMPVLSVLNLAGCTKISDQGFVPLIETISKYHPIRLKHLNLSECINITNRGLATVGRDLPDMEDLCLFSCPQYRDEGLITFVRPNETAKLRSLNTAGDYHITPSLIRQLIMQNPSLIVYRDPEMFPHNGFVVPGDPVGEALLEMNGLEEYHTSVHRRENSRSDLLKLEEAAKNHGSGRGPLSFPVPGSMLRKRGSTEMTPEQVDSLHDSLRRRENDKNYDPYA